MRRSIYEVTFTVRTEAEEAGWLRRAILLAAREADLQFLPSPTVLELHESHALELAHKLSTYFEVGTVSPWCLRLMLPSGPVQVQFTHPHAREVSLLSTAERRPWRVIVRATNA